MTPSTPSEMEFLAKPVEDLRSKTAFIFAGGGSFGAIQVGMLHALATQGVKADMVFGSSVGALNCAYYAGNPTLDGIQQLETIWRSLRRHDVFQVTWRTLFGFLQRRDFLATSEGLRRLVEKHLPYRNLEDATIPVHIIATDILSAETVVLSEGSAADAILASAALPPAFPPVHLDKLYLADGAITSNTPVKIAVARGAQRLIVLPTGYACALQAPPTGAVATALHALTLLIARQLIDELEHLDPSIEYFIAPPLCPLKGSPYDFSQTAELIARAKDSTAAWIAEGGLKHPRVHAQLGLHKHEH
jgi:NTE family protein